MWNCDWNLVSPSYYCSKPISYNIMHYVYSTVRLFVLLAFCFKYWLCFWVSWYFLLFSCIAAEEAHKLGSSAKAVGGEDAEVAYLLFQQRFLLCFCPQIFINFFLWQWSEAVRSLGFKMCDGENWCLPSYRVPLPSLFLSLKRNSGSIDQFVAVLSVACIFVIVVCLCIYPTWCWLNLQVLKVSLGGLFFIFFCWNYAPFRWDSNITV